MRIFYYALILSLMVTSTVIGADDAVDAASGKPQASTAGPRQEMAAIMQEVMQHYRSGNKDKATYEPLLERMDALLEAADPDDLETRGLILGARGGIYHNIFGDIPAAKIEYQRLVEECPESEIASNAAKLLVQLEMLESLVLGGEFPGFSFDDLDGTNISLDAYRGKVVLVDFWATWCPPCIVELPNVLAAYQKYHDKGFEIIGISLDKDKARLEDFLEENGMDWPQYFDGKGWDNELSNKYGVNSIPTTYLLGPDGGIIARDLHGDELEKAVGKALEAL
jgi:thiol-disulfide isomerase/thioredoxin